MESAPLSTHGDRTQVLGGCERVAKWNEEAHAHSWLGCPLPGVRPVGQTVVENGKRSHAFAVEYVLAGNPEQELVRDILRKYLLDGPVGVSSGRNILAALSLSQGCIHL